MDNPYVIKGSISEGLYNGLELDLSRVNVFIGKNGSGKTAVLREI